MNQPKMDQLSPQRNLDDCIAFKEVAIAAIDQSQERELIMIIARATSARELAALSYSHLSRPF